MANNQPVFNNKIGWVYFAVSMMTILGAFEILKGLTAFFKESYYIVQPNTIFNFSFATWGWLHLIFGIAMVVAAYGVMSGLAWGRGLGVVVAIIDTLIALVFMAAYPIWAIIAIILDVIIIYALLVHAQDVNY